MNRLSMQAENQTERELTDMLTAKELLGCAQALEPQLVEWRRTLHRHPEVGFDLTQTKALVKKALTEMGYEPKDCGKAGVIALAGGKKPGKTILLRGDMDALPIQEESGEEFASEVPGKMHGCGHDMHTAMMLGAAKLLKEHEEEIEGTVKLEFQPAEEIFQGSPDMISNGLLENPKVDAAVMFHVLAGMPLPLGEVLVPGGGITMASCEQYHIVVHGKGGHGSMPENCIDPITAAAHIHIALQEINARELSQNDFGVLTTGRFAAGAASNVIPDTAEMWGTIRTVDPEQKVSALIHQRMTEIAQGVATAYRCTADLSIYVDRACRGSGVGQKLYAEIERLGRERGIENLISIITSDNEGSLRFHRKNGFTEIGVMPAVAFKFGKYLDVSFFQKHLG